jgi:hypothetical protein
MEINEKKTGKLRRITPNRVCIQTIRNLLEKESHHPGEHLVKSQFRRVISKLVFGERCDRKR